MVVAMMKTYMRIFGFLTLKWTFGLKLRMLKIDQANELAALLTALRTISICLEDKVKMATKTMNSIRSHLRV